MSRLPRGRIIGVGSPFGADSTGWRVVEYLQEAGFPELFPRVDWQILDRPGPRLMEWFADMDLVIIIDALLGGVQGESRVLDAAALTENASLSTHGFGVAEALAMAEALDELPTHLVILAIEVGDGETVVSCNYQVVVDRLVRLLSDYGFSPQ
ncbi:hydrogenase maturation protease [Thiohalomonas denitrificans]|uniref:Hydrogenase maturation protease n=1 Tax=Thiohalomonas denitrificans TaxID=415747 RepID=A0A1G5PLW7_9GAMM|nr:hydrogenase maturation protease [Thiohalomonas denitrificans]SCZ50201.1 hydrogenase maturation protease [Thiohalomonas denitrificans]